MIHWQSARNWRFFFLFFGGTPVAWHLWIQWLDFVAIIKRKWCLIPFISFLHHILYTCISRTILTWEWAYSLLSTDHHLFHTFVYFLIHLSRLCRWINGRCFPAFQHIPVVYGSCVTRSIIMLRQHHSKILQLHDAISDTSRHLLTLSRQKISKWLPSNVNTLHANISTRR